MGVHAQREPALGSPELEAFDDATDLILPATARGQQLLHPTHRRDQSVARQVPASGVAHRCQHGGSQDATRA